MKGSSSEEVIQGLQGFLEKRGREVLEVARKTVAEEQERIECIKVKEALNYFIDEYPVDKVRPALSSILCEAVGGKLEITQSVAVPLILINGATGIHGEIIDGSKSKDGKPTVYGKYGRDIALLVGDALLFKGLILLYKTENLSRKKRSTLPALRGKIAMMSPKMQETSRQEEIIARVQKMMEERGAKPLKIARKEILRGDIKSVELRGVLNYFVRERWEEIRPFVVGPTVISLACEAVGGDAEITVSTAASIALIGSGIEMHDDIIDGSKAKRSRVTVFGKFGAKMALIAGRALIVKGLTLLHKASREGIPANKIVSISDTVKKAFFEYGDAVGLALELRENLDIAPEKYMHITRKKGSIIEGQARIGAIIGGGTKEEVEALGRYGRLLGMLLTIRGEFVDMFETDELHHRRTNECLPLPILYALQNQKVKKQTIQILEKETLTKKDVDTLVNVIYGAKQVESLRKKMRKLGEEANLALVSLVHSASIDAFNLFVLASLENLSL